MKIEINENGQAEIYTPYNNEFVTKLKNGIGAAKWNPTKKCWCVPERAVDSVREIMLAVYGETDIETQEHVDIKVTFNRDVREYYKPITLFSKTVATAYGRDSGAKVGKYIEIIKGNVTSGGSAKHWTTEIEEGTVLIIRDVCKSFVDEWNDDEILVEILGDVSIDKGKLLEEKEKLLCRIKEIDKLLEVKE